MPITLIHKQKDIVKRFWITAAWEFLTNSASVWCKIAVNSGSILTYVFPCATKSI